MKITKDQICHELVRYLANLATPSQVAKSLDLVHRENDVARILCDYQREWDSAEYDGVSPEQETELDLIIDRYADKLIAIESDPVIRYVNILCGKIAYYLNQPRRRGDGIPQKIEEN